MNETPNETSQSTPEATRTPGIFLSFVLLEEDHWDKAALQRELSETWGITDQSDDPEDGGAEHLLLVWQGAFVSVSLLPAPIPNEEAETAAAGNYLWPDGAAVTEKHQAHLLVSVLGRGMPPMEAGMLMAKVTSACCHQPGVLGVYTNEVVYPPEYYLHFSAPLAEGDLPIYTLIWCGLYRDALGLCAYTCGLNAFGHDEIEVLDSQAEPEDLLATLYGIANYVITQDVTLQDGETIGFTAEQVLPIHKGEGRAVPGSIQIEYCPL